MKIRKKAVRGYAESAVREELKLRQETHRLRMKGLEEELQALQHDNGRLRRELEHLESHQPDGGTVAGDDPVHLIVQEKLLHIHLEQSGDVWEAMKRLKELEEELRVELVEKQRECDDLLERRAKGEAGGLTGNGVQNNEASE
ncbi:hypothetical protein KP806_16470 [Paenibacillus sp. N4]|uniref:hypothetical protein n=1 Tax=Paenibacillus vietnamensis TaxID=2590547 RepID=UPI001CD0CBCE|nr:hypothetical protein [Paenibacillus vietnamensis]MCA0756652.1 hypothetical protein [Paenibacillus vietnamensis]